MSKCYNKSARSWLSTSSAFFNAPVSYKQLERQMAKITQNIFVINQF